MWSDRYSNHVTQIHFHTVFHGSVLLVGRNPQPTMRHISEHLSFLLGELGQNTRGNTIKHYKINALEVDRRKPIKKDSVQSSLDTGSWVDRAIDSGLGWDKVKIGKKLGVLSVRHLTFYCQINFSLLQDLQWPAMTISSQLYLNISRSSVCVRSRRCGGRHLSEIN